MEQWNPNELTTTSTNIYYPRRQSDSIRNRPNLPELNGAETEQLKTTLFDNIDVFTRQNNELGLCPHIEHTIELIDSKPIRMQPYTASKSDRKFICQETKEWLKKEIIRRSK